MFADELVWETDDGLGFLFLFQNVPGGEVMTLFPAVSQ